MARKREVLDHLDVYGDYIPEDEGGKAAPLARPTAPPPAGEEAPSNVILLAPRRRTG